MGRGTGYGNERLPLRPVCAAPTVPFADIAPTIERVLWTLTHLTDHAERCAQEPFCTCEREWLLDALGSLLFLSGGSPERASFAELAERIARSLVHMGHFRECQYLATTPVLPGRGCICSVGVAMRDFAEVMESLGLDPGYSV